MRVDYRLCFGIVFIARGGGHPTIENKLGSGNFVWVLGGKVLQIPRARQDAKAALAAATAAREAWR